MSRSSGKATNPLKVLLVAPNFHHAIGILARYIVKNCPNIDFFVIDVDEVNASPTKFAQLVHSVDVVHWLANLSTTEFTSADLPAQLPCPSIASIHHIAPDETDKLAAANAADVIHVSCLEWLNYITPLTKTPVRMAYYPVDVSRYKHNGLVAQPHTPFRVGFLGVGSVLTRKRLHVLLDALALLESRGVKIQLWTQSLYWPDVKVPGIPPRILKFEPFHNSWRSYASFDVFVCCSDFEGGPLTVLEALASEVPVISTPVGLAPELLARGGGIIVEKGRPDKLAEALEYLFRNPDVYRRLKGEARPAVQQFISSVDEQYFELYAAAITYWEKKHQTSWIRKPALRRWKTRAQRFNMYGRDLRNEARKMRALGQYSTALFALLRICNPYRLFEY